MFADATQLAIRAADPVLQFGGMLTRQHGADASSLLGQGKITDTLEQVAIGTAAEDFAGAVVDVDEFAVLDDGQPFLDVVSQVAETFFVKASGVFGLLVLCHLQGKLHVQARKFTLMGAGALFEVTVELQEVRFEAGGGRVNLEETATSFSVARGDASSVSPSAVERIPKIPCRANAVQPLSGGENRLQIPSAINSPNSSEIAMMRSLRQNTRDIFFA